MEMNMAADPTAEPLRDQIDARRDRARGAVALPDLDGPVNFRILAGT
jgi:hypothetical protein